MQRSSYKEEDVTLLLKDLTSKIEPMSTSEREKKIQSGTHYCEMLPIEKAPTEEYNSIYRELLDKYAKVNADAIARLCYKIIERRGSDIVLVSLARAGTTIGVLIKHYLKMFLGIDVDHYTISIIRGRGIDRNAMNYLLSKYKPESIVFVDGWTGKGAIYNQLKEALKEYNGVSSELAVVSDPACVTDLYGTREDILIPSSCLNSTVSGLISRTILRDDLIGENEYHGYVYYSEFEGIDLTYDFISRIEKEFTSEVTPETNKICSTLGLVEAMEIAKNYDIKNINLVKPSVGETTRVLLRRIPWKILINEKDKDSKYLKHILCLAKEKNVEVEYINLVHYKCVGIIKELEDA